MTTELAGICLAIIDCEHRTAPAGDGHALLVGTRAMKNGRLVVEACKPVSEATYNGWTSRIRPRHGDLILAREAPVGQVVRVPKDIRVCLGQRTVLIRPDAAKVHPRFLHYWLLGPEAQAAMASRAAGVTVPHLNVHDIRNLNISRLPSDPGVQGFAASTLGAMDDLIENIRGRIELLGRMVRRIYREWFIHFRYPGHERVALRPSPLGPIPEGWDVCPVAGVAAGRNAVTGGPFGSKLGRMHYVDSGVPVIRGTNLRVGGGFDDANVVFVTEDKARELSSSLARRGDVVITQRGTLGQVGLIPDRSRFGIYLLSQSQMKITVDHSKATPGFVYSQFRTAETTARFAAQAMSSGVPHVNLALLRDFEIILPPLHLQHRFGELVAGLLVEDWVLAEQVRGLIDLRDSLLPRLIMGTFKRGHPRRDAVGAP